MGMKTIRFFQEVKKISSVKGLIFWTALSACAPQETQSSPPPVEPEEKTETDPEPEESQLLVDAPNFVDYSVTPEKDQVAARHILVSYKGARSCPINVVRSREQAADLANSYRDQIQKGASFEVFANKYSDDPSKARGGFLGAISKGTMVEKFEKAVFSLDVGQISEVVETEYGFHIIMREPLEQAHVAQILIQWKGIKRSRASRTKEEALELANKARSELLEGKSFSEVTAKYSDGPMALRGGDLGWFTRGQFLPTFEEAAFELQPGEYSDIIETLAGLHIILRIKD